MFVHIYTNRTYMYIYIQTYIYKQRMCKSPRISISMKKNQIETLYARITDRIQNIWPSIIIQTTCVLLCCG